jgi:hypothetical protein
MRAAPIEYCMIHEYEEPGVSLVADDGASVDTPGVP